VLGAIIVWPGKSVFSEGAIPDDPDLRYSFNNDMGVLHFLRQSDAGSETVAVAHLGRDGIFFEIETGTPVARMVGGSIIFDAASLANVTDEAPARSEAKTDARAFSLKRESEGIP
jgi:hypothetical protein